MRKDWDECFMNMCELLAKERSTCVRLNTAAIITRHNRSVSMGYNGVPSGHKHCIDYDWCHNDGAYVLDGRPHHDWSINNEIHGEMNAILYAAKEGIPLDGCTIYTLYSPCIECAKAIDTVGIQTVYYRHFYNDAGLNYCETRNIKTIYIDRE